MRAHPKSSGKPSGHIGTISFHAQLRFDDHSLLVIATQLVPNDFCLVDPPDQVLPDIEQMHLYK